MTQKIERARIMKKNKNGYILIQDFYSRRNEESTFRLVDYFIMALFDNKEKAVQYFYDFINDAKKKSIDWDGTFKLGQTNDILCYQMTDFSEDLVCDYRLTERTICNTSQELQEVCKKFNN